MRLLCAVAVATLVSSGCTFSSTGDFDGVGFSPGSTVFAMHDRHEFIVAGGETSAHRLPESELSLTLMLSAATIPVEEEWRRFRASRLLEMKKELAVRDGLLLEGIPLDVINPGDDVELVFDGGRGAGSDELSSMEASIVSALPSEDTIAAQGFGSLITLQIVFDEVEIGPSAGVVSGQIDIKRDRGDGQTGEVATGQVSLQFRADIVNERLGKANLAHLAPVLHCAAERGPSRAGGCRDVPPDPIIDETSTLNVP